MKIFLTHVILQKVARTKMHRTSTIELAMIAAYNVARHVIRERVCEPLRSLFFRRSYVPFSISMTHVRMHTQEAQKNLVCHIFI